MRIHDISPACPTFLKSNRSNSRAWRMAQARTTSASRHPPRPLPSPFPFPSTQWELRAGPAAGSVSWMGLSRSPPPAVGTEMESPCPGLKFWAGMSYSREEVAQLRSQQCHPPLGTPHSPREQPRASPAGLGLTQWARKAITRRWSEHGQRFHCLNPQIKLPSHSTASCHGQKHTKSQAEEPREASAPSSAPGWAQPRAPVPTPRSLGALGSPAHIQGHRPAQQGRNNS